jgi:hypothetical protein
MFAKAYFPSAFWSADYFASSVGSGVVIPPEEPPITAPGGGRGGKAKRKRQYQIAANADPARPYATRLEPVGYEAPAPWAPTVEIDAHEEDEMLMLLAVFG